MAAPDTRRVTSLTNPLVKLARGLHLRKEREAQRPVSRRRSEDNH